MKKHVWKIVAAGVVILLAGSFFISNQAAKEANVGVELQTWVVGNPEASVVLTEYSDFQCPACRQFFPVVKDILAEYGEQIRFEYKHFPLISIHPFAVPAARAAEAAGQQGKFFEMHDILFEEQPNWSRSSAPEAFFLQYAEQLELDIDMFKRHMGSSLIDEAITDSYREAQGKGFTSTPTFELNGVRMQYETFDDFLSQIEAAVGVTSSASGTPATTTTNSDVQVEFGI